jgi:hypothetical protein
LVKRVLDSGSEFELGLTIDFHEVKEFFDAIRDIYCLYRQSGAAHQYEDQLDVLIFNHYNFAKHVRDA